MMHNYFSLLPAELQSVIFRLAYPKQAARGAYMSFMIWRPNVDNINHPGRVEVFLPI
jgi:hypothetical protein